MGFYWILWASPAQLHYFSSLGSMGLSSTPYFLCFHYFGPAVTHSHFSISYAVHDLLFLSFRAPLSPFNSSIISWAYDLLFLPLGLNEFSIRLPTPFCLCYWASPFHLGFLIEEAFGHYEALLIWSITMSYWWPRETLIWIGTANKMFVTKRVFSSLWFCDVTLCRNITLL